MSRDSHEWFDLGLTLVDSLDTLALMGLEPELAEARTWVMKSLVLAQVRISVIKFYPTVQLKYFPCTNLVDWSPAP